MAYKFNPFTGTLDEVGVGGGGGGGTPGGSDTQVQYNSSGSFAGSADLTWNDTAKELGVGGSITLSLNGAASTPPLALTGTWFSGGTSTTTKPQVLIEPSGTTSTTWSTSGTGLGVNAPSGFSGNLLDLLLNGANRLSVTNAGVGGGQYGQLVLHGAAATQARLGCVDVNTFGILFSAVGEYVRFSPNTGFNFAGGLPIGFSNGGLTSTGVMDVRLYRDGAANTLAQRNGTNAQTTRIYDTYTSATDYHRIAIATARATLTGVSGASVTATGLIPAGAVVMGVTSKVTTALGTGNGTTGYQIGTGADADRWGAITGTAAGTTSDNRDWTAGTIECFPSATDVVVTATGGNFDGTGVIYLSVQYMTGQAD